MAKRTNSIADVSVQVVNDNGAPREPAAAPSDPFANLESLRLSQNFAELADVKPVITTCAVRKPNRHEFVRVRSGVDWRFETGIFADKSDAGESYLVAPHLWPELPGDVTPTLLVVCATRNSPVPFLWPLPLPSADGRSNRWHESAIEAAKLAEARWMRIVADMSAGCYVPHVAAGNLADPKWPADITLEDLMRLAFRGRFIGTWDHTALKRLRGEV